MRLVRRGIAALCLLGALLCAEAPGEPLYSWEAYRARSRRKGGLFGRWAPDQAAVQRALRMLERRTQEAVLPQRDAEAALRTAPASELELLARRCLREGRVVRAEKLLRSAIGRDPDARGGRLLLAGMYERCGRDDLAVAELEALVHRRSEEREGRRRLAGLYGRTGRAEDAARVLDELSRLEPENAALRREHVAAVIRVGRKDAAEKAVKALLSGDPKVVESRLVLARYYRVYRQPVEAREVLEELYKECRRADVAEELAMVLLRLQEPGPIRAVLEPWADRPDARPATLMAAVAAQAAAASEMAGELSYRLRERGYADLATDMLASAWLARGDVAGIDAVVEAAPDAQRSVLREYRTLNEALSDKPADRRRVAFLLSAATVLYYTGWAEEAVGLLRVADRLAPDSPLIGTRLVRAASTVTSRESVLALWEKLAADFPGNTDITIGHARARVDAGELDEAEAICRKALGSTEHKTGLRLLLADIASREGRYGEAAAVAQAILGREAAHPGAYRRLLDARLVQGDLAAIDRAFSARRIAEPTYLPGQFERIIRLARQEKGDSALVQMRAALARQPFDWRLQHLAGLLYAAADRWQEAGEAFDTVRLVRPALVPARVNRLRVAVRGGDLALARTLAAEVAKDARDEVAVQIAFADHLARKGQVDEAVAHLASLRPRSAGARHDVQSRLAWLFLQQGKRFKAAEFAERVLSADPAHVRARTAAAEAYRSLGDLRGAVAMYERLLTARPKMDVDHELGILRLFSGASALNDAWQRLDRALAQAQGRRRYPLLLCASAARLGRGDIPRARDAAVRALEARPRDGHPSAELYLLLALTGEGERAEKDLAVIRRTRPEIAEWLHVAAEKVRQSDPKLATPFVVGYLATRFGWGREAVRHFESVRRDNPQEPAVLYATATTHLAIGRTGQGLVSARELVGRRPKSGRAQILLGQLLERQGQLDEAAEAYKQASRLIDQKAVPLWFEMARHLARVKSIDAAVAAYRRILALEPENGKAMNSLAWLYVTEMPDRLDEARRLATRAVEVLPESAPVHDTLGWVLFVSGKKETDAERHVRRALELAPRPVYHYHLGMIAYRQGKLAAARQALKHALELDPKLPDGDTARATLKLIEDASPKP